MPRLSRTTILGSIRDWYAEEAGRHGHRGAIGHLTREILGFLVDSTPARRRQRYGDIDYDWDFRVNTTGATVSWRDRLIGIFHAPYQPTEPALFHEMISRVTADLKKFVFIDLGSGKGRVLLMASDYPFRKILGVELLPELHRLAEENIENYSSSSQKCTVIESICTDARLFDFPDEPLVLYLFNPLPEAGLAAVIGRLEASLEKTPREAWILYHNPLLEHVFASTCAFVKVHDTGQYVVYRGVTDPVELESNSSQP